MEDDEIRERLIDQRRALDTVERYEALTKETKNPLYVWLGIAYALAYDAPIPAWALSYIRSCSFEILYLCQRVAWDELPITVHATDGHEITPTMEPDEAAERIAAALEITRPGYNAFLNLRRDEQKIQDASYLNLLEAKRQWRNESLFVGIPAEHHAAADKHFSERFGPRETAQQTTERALEVIKKRRNIDTEKQVKSRVKRGRKLLDPTGQAEPRG